MGHHISFLIVNRAKDGQRLVRTHVVGANLGAEHSVLLDHLDGLIEAGFGGKSDCKGWVCMGAFLSG